MGKRCAFQVRLQVEKKKSGQADARDCRACKQRIGARRALGFALAIGLCGYAAGLLNPYVFYRSPVGMTAGALVLEGAVGLFMVAFVISPPSDSAAEPEPRLASAPVPLANVAAPTPASTPAPGVDGGRTEAPASESEPTPLSSRAPEVDSRVGNAFSSLRMRVDDDLARRGLTPREIDVASRLACGSTYRAIGDELRLTESTVKFHAKNAYAKTGVKSKQELMQLLRCGKTTARR